MKRTIAIIITLAIVLSSGLSFYSFFKSSSKQETNNYISDENIDTSEINSLEVVKIMTEDQITISTEYKTKEGTGLYLDSSKQTTCEFCWDLEYNFEDKEGKNNTVSAKIEEGILKSLEFNN